MKNEKKKNIPAKLLSILKDRVLIPAFVTPARGSQLHCAHHSMPPLFCRGMKSHIAKPQVPFPRVLLFPRFSPAFSLVWINILFHSEYQAHQPTCPSSGLLAFLSVAFSLHVASSLGSELGLCESRVPPKRVHLELPRPWLKAMA